MALKRELLRFFPQGLSKEERHCRLELFSERGVPARPLRVCRRFCQLSCITLSERVLAVVPRLNANVAPYDITAMLPRVRCLDVAADAESSLLMRKVECELGSSPLEWRFGYKKGVMYYLRASTVDEMLERTPEDPLFPCERSLLPILNTAVRAAGVSSSARPSNQLRRWRLAKVVLAEGRRKGGYC